MALITVLRSSRGRVHISMYKCITEKYKRNTAVTLLLSCIIKKTGLSSPVNTGFIYIPLSSRESQDLFLTAAGESLLCDKADC